ncbi:MAG: ATP-binding protein [Sedimenticola sp.]|nr:ATP-binding protein [Sedimenticola sp.]
MKLLKMLKTQIAAALVLIMLLFGSTLYLSMRALDEQQSYNLLLNITSRLEQTAQNLVTLGLNYSMNVPLDSASYERDVRLYYRALTGQIEMLDTITNSFMTEEFSPDLVETGDPFHPQLSEDTQQTVLAVEELWLNLRQGIFQALGNDSEMPRLGEAADYIARYHSPLVASIDILLTKIQQQTGQRLKQVYQLHIILLFSAVLITFGVFGWFFLAVLKPLKSAVNGFQKVAQGDFGHQLPIISGNELGMMTRAFNTLSLRLHAIFRLIDQIQKGSDLHETLGFVANEFPPLLPLDWVGVLFVAADGRTIVLEDSYRQGKPEIARRTRYPLGNTLLLKALESGEPLHIPDMPTTGQQNTEFQFLNDLIDKGLGDAIFLPIGELSPIPGVLAFATSSLNSYSDKHLELLTNIAGLITHSFGRTVKLAEHGRLAAIGGFASGIAHEIRSPLSTINMALDYIQGSELPEATRKRARLAGLEAERLTRLLEEMLLYAKPMQLELEPVDVTQLLTDLLDNYRDIPQERAQEIEFDGAGTGHTVRGDRDRLIQVFLNLIRNACEAAPESGRINCALRKDEGSGTITVTICNRGDPIAPDHMKKLFDPFFTTKTNGTGLGLGIVKRIVEGHGGEIQVASSLDQGTRVRVVLPAG